jgi:regulator of sigma E protease
MSFIEIFQTLGANIWLYGGAFVLVLSILVFVHEWGHYIVARMCGVGVEVFSIGFGRELFGFHDKHGTRWKVCLIPLGGYVKLFGDVDPASMKHDDSVKDEQSGEIRALSDEEKKVAFFSKPVWQRALIVIAGPAINYIFAIVLLSLLFVFNGQPVTPPSAAAVIVGSSAEKYGFQPHDMVVSIDGSPVKSFEDIRRAMMISLDQERHFVIERDGLMFDINAKPEKLEEKDRFGFVQSRGMLGLISPRHAIDIKTIEAIDGIKFTDSEDVRGELQARLDTVFEVQINRGQGETDYLIVHPMASMNGSLSDTAHKDHDVLFVSDHSENTFIQHGPVDAVKQALYESWSITTGTLEALWQMITGTRSARELGGVIRIGALAGDMAQQGIVALILFTALLSINLGLINLFPVPLLDGGHLVFYAVEAIIGKPIPDQIQEYAFRLGLAFLVCIMVFANLNDIMHLILKS